MKQLKRMINENTNLLSTNLQLIAPFLESEEDYLCFRHVTPLVQNRVLYDEVGGGAEGDVYRLNNGHLLKIREVGLYGQDDTKHYIKTVADAIYSGTASKQDMSFFGHWIVKVPGDYEENIYEIVEMADVITLEQWAKQTGRSQQKFSTGIYNIAKALGALYAKGKLLGVPANSLISLNQDPITQEEFIEFVVATQDWSKKHGKFPRDLHAGNVGISPVDKSTFLFFDVD